MMRIAFFSFHFFFEWVFFSALHFVSLQRIELPCAHSVFFINFICIAGFILPRLCFVSALLSFISLGFINHFGYYRHLDIIH